MTVEPPNRGDGFASRISFARHDLISHKPRFAQSGIYLLRKVLWSIYMGSVIVTID
jgi:hypothetical protein